MPGCSGHLRFLAAFGWCRNDEVCGRRLAILFSEQCPIINGNQDDLGNPNSEDKAFRESP